MSTPMKEELEEVGRAILDCGRFNDIDTIKDIVSQLQENYPVFLGDLLNFTDEAGNNVFHMCAANGSLDVLKFLDTLQIVKFCKNEAGNTPLIWAVQSQKEEIVQLLLGKDGMDVLDTNKQGLSCITYGYDGSNTKILDLILSHSSAKPLEQDSTNEAKEMIHEVKFFKDKQSIYVREVANEANLDLEGSENLDETGVNLWASSLVLARWLVDMEDRFANKCVLELGAGCGLPGLVVSSFSSINKIFTSETKKFKKTFENLEHNFSSNNLQNNVKEIDWTDPTSFSWLQTADLDFIIGSDLIYDSALVAPFIDVILSAAKNRPSFTLFYVTIEKNRQGFLEVLNGLKMAGFAIEEEKCPQRYREEIKQAFVSEKSLEIFDIHFEELETEEFKLYTFSISR